MTLDELVEALTVERFAPARRRQPTVAEVATPAVVDWQDDEISQARRRRGLADVPHDVPAAVAQ